MHSSVLIDIILLLPDMVLRPQFLHMGYLTLTGFLFLSFTVFIYTSEVKSVSWKIKLADTYAELKAEPDT